MPDPGPGPLVRAPGSTSSPSPGQARDPADRAGQASEFTVGPATRPGAWSSPCPTRTRAGRARSPTITGLLLVMAGDRVPGRGPRRGVPRPPVHDPAHAPDRGVAPAGRGRPVVARADRRGVVEHDRAARAVAAVQHDGRPARAERRDHPPRPRLQPRLPGRREPRAADPDRRDAHVHRAPPGPGRARPRRADRVPRLVGRPARPARLARPEPARALEARLGARAAGPAPRRRAGHDRVRRRAAAARRGAQGPRAHDVPAVEPAPDPPRPAAARPGRSPTSSATRSSSRSTDGSTSSPASCPTAARRSRSWTRAAGSRRPSCR